MATNRFTIDAFGKRAYVGSKVSYNDKVWLLEDIQYLSWSASQYLTLQDVRNKNKKLQFISPLSVKVVR
jgi:hypothetical protein